MSMTSTGTLSIEVGVTTHDYVEQQRLGNKAVYSDASRPLGNPKTVEISHQIVNPGKSAERVRSMIKISTKEENPSLEGDRVSGSVHVVLDYPTRIFEVATIQDLYDQLNNLLMGNGIFTKLINREV